MDRYTSIAATPRRLPRAAADSSTAKVWPVRGTGVNGNGMAIWADRATNTAAPTTSTT